MSIIYYHMPEPAKALKNIRRVLKNDGILIAPTFTRSGSFKDRLIEKPLEFVGFKTFSNWTYTEYIKFLKNNQWIIVKKDLIKARFPIAFIVAKQFL